MAPFPLLKLPFLAQKNIILQMNLLIKNIIELTMLSEKFKKLVEVIKFDVHSFRYVFEKKRFELHIVTLKKRSMSITSFFRPKTFGGLEKRKVHGKSVLTCRDPKNISGLSEHDTDKSRMNLLELFTRHLLSFLRAERFEIEFRRSLEFKDMSIWNCIPHFDGIRICEISTTTGKPQRVFMTPDNLAFVLENVSTDYLYLYVTILNNRDFKYQFQEQKSEPSKIRKIRIVNLSWINMDNVLNSNYKSIVLENFNGDVKQLLNQWITGKNEELEELVFLISGRYTIERELKEISTTPTSFTKEELQTRYRQWVEGDTTKDIRRKHDGRLATVIVLKEKVKMYVWNEKHLKAIGRL